MPAARRYNPSVPPITIIGTAGTPGQSDVVTAVMADMRSSRRGEGGPLWGVPSTVITIAVSAMIRWSVDVTDATDSSGNTRQLTFAVAICGRAFLAWPPSSCVATHVVRSVAFHAVDAPATRLIATVSPSETRARSALMGPFSMPAIARK